MITLFTTLVLFLLWKSNIIKCGFGWVFAPILLNIGILLLPTILIISSGGLEWCDINGILSCSLIGYILACFVFVLMICSYCDDIKEKEKK